MDENAFAKLAQDFRGQVIGRDHPDYEDARKLYNGMINKHPLLIARCLDVADVIAGVNFGREVGLPIAIRGGGHSGPGLGSVDDGIVIDVSPMKGVRVDPVSRTVRVGAGCVIGDVDHAAYAFGLAVPLGVVSTTGVAGLTLSGGHGHLSRRYGLAIDNLLEADVVLADGSFVTASETSNPDLLWALRGGGGNFGVVTSFLFRAHPIGEVYAGPIFWELSDAPEIMRWYRGFVAGAPEDFNVVLGFHTVPPADPFPQEHWGKLVCMLLVCDSGPIERGAAEVDELRAALPPPIIDLAGPMPYPALQSMFDPLFPTGMQVYWKGDFVNELSDEAIEAHLANAAKMTSPISMMHLNPIDGAIHRQPKDATAWNTRDAMWSMEIVGFDADPAKANDVKQWAQRYWEDVHPYDRAGAYPNFMMDDEGEARIAASFGDNYPRLASLKQKYDPGNLFHVNHNIRPSAGLH
ncbi:MAG TPA: FAD-binding oxidoreductase [Devosiaceae bacterium]|nr:FAD-binding oxidoreductase [Devosiaceae bacterium]